MMQGFEENEISEKSNGGTEITKRSVAKQIPEELTKEFQIIPARVRELNEDKIRVYWQHDLAEDPEVQNLRDENFRNKFHKIVFSSNWQMNEFTTKLNMPYEERLTVIETPIEPIQKHVKPKDEVNLIYFSTPHRGLNILVPTFEAIADKYDNIHLHVFSSFKIYGWEEADKAFEPFHLKVLHNHIQSYVMHILVF